MLSQLAGKCRRHIGENAERIQRAERSIAIAATSTIDPAVMAARVAGRIAQLASAIALVNCRSASRA